MGLVPGRSTPLVLVKGAARTSRSWLSGTENVTCCDVRPRPPLPPSAHDVVREARLQVALAPLGIRTPCIRAVCEDDGFLGVPFYVADYVDGFVVTDELPPGLDRDARARRRLAEDLVDALVEIHAVDTAVASLAPFVRPGSYLERQVRRFSQLWQINATRPLPVVGQVGAKLGATMPEPLPPAVVHGDYRLGNMIVVPGQSRPYRRRARLGNGCHR